MVVVPGEDILPSGELSGSGGERGWGGSDDTGVDVGDVRADLYLVMLRPGWPRGRPSVPGVEVALGPAERGRLGPTEDGEADPPGNDPLGVCRGLWRHWKRHLMVRERGQGIRGPSNPTPWRHANDVVETVDNSRGWCSGPVDEPGGNPVHNAVRVQGRPTRRETWSRRAAKK